MFCPEKPQPETERRSRGVSAVALSKHVRDGLYPQTETTRTQGFEANSHYDKLLYNGVTILASPSNMVPLSGDFWFYPDGFNIYAGRAISCIHRNKHNLW